MGGYKLQVEVENGVEADYPHQDTLPISEIVRCSCLIIFR